MGLLSHTVLDSCLIKVLKFVPTQNGEKLQIYLIFLRSRYSLPIVTSTSFHINMWPIRYKEYRTFLFTYHCISLQCFVMILVSQTNFERSHTSAKYVLNYLQTNKCMPVLNIFPKEWRLIRL